MKTNSKQTPGPWAIQRQGPEESRYVIGPESGTDPGRFIARIDNEASDADWRLIAAAPELLAALRKIHSNAEESAEWIRRVIEKAIEQVQP